MIATRTSLTRDDMPSDLKELREEIQASIQLSDGQYNERLTDSALSRMREPEAMAESNGRRQFYEQRAPNWGLQIGTLGSGNNFLTGSTAASYTDSAIEAEQTYSYQVQAVGDHGDGYLAGYVRIKAPDAGTPPAPTGLTAVYDSAAGTVTLAWTAPNPRDKLTGYPVYRCREWLADGSHCATILTGYTAATYVDQAVSSTRSYQARALNASGDSPYSNRVYLSID